MVEYVGFLTNTTLLCTSGWAFYAIGGCSAFRMSCVSFGMTFVNAAVGIAASFDVLNNYLVEIHDFTLFLRNITGLSYITADLYLGYHRPTIMAYAHVITCLFVPVYDIVDPSRSAIVEEVVIVGNLFSLGYITYVNDNVWGMKATLMFTLARYMGINTLVLAGSYTILDLPPGDFYELWLCLVTYCTVNALKAIKA